MIDPSILTHHSVNIRKAYRYAKDMERGDKFPAVQVSINNKTGQIVVKGGAHRTFAAKMSEKLLLIRTKINFKKFKEV